MSPSNYLNKEKSARVVELIPQIFKAPYLAENAVLIGGSALNLEFPQRRFSEDMDLDCFDCNHSSFEKRTGYLADDLRSVAKKTGYGFKIRIGKSTKASFFYTNSIGHPDAFDIDVHVTPDPHYLKIVEKSYPETGAIRVMQFEEMLGMKMSMLSRPRKRGHKRFSDLLDVYNSTWCVLNTDLAKQMFVNYMSRLGIRITPNKFVEMLDWHEPAKFEQNIESRTDQHVTFRDLRSRVLSRYGDFCNLNSSQKETNSYRMDIQ